MAEKAVWRKTTGLWIFYNVVLYVLINTLLIAIWAVSESGSPWFLWVTLIWAGALVILFGGYAVGYRYGASRERMIEEHIAAYREKHPGAEETPQAGEAWTAAAEEQQAPPEPPGQQSTGE
ncbi:MAG: 2TM domain-containing protein [Actinomycetota bacterium]